MSMIVVPLAAGDGWSASSYLCSAGPTDPAFEEQHQSVSIAAVVEGTFHYRTRQGAALMAPGSLLLGNQGACFECGHQHGVGDRCIGFHFESAFFERVVATIPGARRLDFTQARLAPTTTTAALVAQAESAITDSKRLEELALDLAGATIKALIDTTRTEFEAKPSTKRRITEIVRYLERSFSEDHPLAQLADLAAMSPYHFLREFRRVVGVTPHQYVLSMRLREVARRLRSSDENIAVVAVASGFGDISEFNRHFQKNFDMTPQMWRNRTCKKDD